MSQYSEERIINQPFPMATAMCYEAAKGLSWKLRESSSNRLVIKEPLLGALIGNPATIEVTLEAVNSNTTRIRYQGSNFGFGPLNTDRIKKAIATFHAKMQSITSLPEAENRMLPQEQASIESRLLHINELQEKNLISDEEYQKRRQQILDEL